MSSTPVTLKPQKGPQEAFLASAADIVIYGGGAGGGKTFGLLLEPLRHVANKDFGATIFRRTYPMITAQGGLWEESEKIYTLLGAAQNASSLTWTFPSGAQVAFRHLQHEKNKLDYQGAQIPLICFDELTHFTETQFFYLLTRNRSTCGVRPYVRATCNPDPDSWVKAFIQWWIDEETGLAIKERAGCVRYFVRESGELHWADSPDDLEEQFPGSQPKSVTFIPSSVHDNPALLKKDPGYLANLHAQDAVTRAQLLDGNWNAKAAAGLYFKSSYFPVVQHPKELKGCRLVRFWDMAATEPSQENTDPDYLVGLLLAAFPDGTFTVLDVQRGRMSPQKVEELIKKTAEADRAKYGRGVTVYMEQEPGSSGKSLIDHYRRVVLRGYAFKSERPTGDKVTRAQPASSAAEGGLISIVRAPWNAAFTAELEAFPDGAHDDIADALSGAHRALTRPVASGRGALI